MVNLTITVPEELKAQMDAQAEVNWSEVCRTAISVYINNRKNMVPRLSLRVDRTDFVYFPATVYPQVRLQLSIKNEMSREIVLDRVLYTTTFSIAKSGLQIAYLEGAYLNKHVLAPDATVGFSCYHNFEHIIMERLIHLVHGSMGMQTAFTVFVEGMKQPLAFGASGIIAVDEWEEASGKYQDAMNPSRR